MATDHSIISSSPSSTPIIEYYFCHICAKLNPFIISIIMCGSIGVCLIMSGIIMRLEQMWSMPYISTQACYKDLVGSELRYVGSPQICNISSAVSSSTIFYLFPFFHYIAPQHFYLQNVQLIVGVDYIPILIYPYHVSSGLINIQVSMGENRIYELYRPLGVDDDDLDTKTLSYGSKISIYRSDELYPSQNIRCGQMDKGCLHKLDDYMNLVVVRGHSFNIPAPDNAKVFYTTNYTLSLFEISLFLPYSPTIPFQTALPFFFSLQPDSLSDVQIIGVVYICSGVAILLLGLAFLLLQEVCPFTHDIKSFDVQPTISMNTIAKLEPITLEQKYQ